MSAAWQNDPQVVLDAVMAHIGPNLAALVRFTDRRAEFIASVIAHGEHDPRTAHAYRRMQDAQTDFLAHFRAPSID